MPSGVPVPPPRYWFDALRRAAHRTGHLGIVDDVRRPVLGVAFAVDPVALCLDGGHSSPQRKERVDLAVGCCEVLVQLDERVQLAQRLQVQKRRHWVVLVDVLPPRGARRHLRARRRRAWWRRGGSGAPLESRTAHLDVRVEAERRHDERASGRARRLECPHDALFLLGHLLPRHCGTPRHTGISTAVTCEWQTLRAQRERECVCSEWRVRAPYEYRSSPSTSTGPLAGLGGAVGRHSPQLFRHSACMYSGLREHSPSLAQATHSASASAQLLVSAKMDELVNTNILVSYT